MTDVASPLQVPEIREVPPAEEQASTENVATSSSTSVKASQLRVEELKDELNSSFSYTSEEEGHSHGSDDPDKTKEEEFTPPTEELIDKIMKQVEFYFSDANILKDAFLLKHVRRNKQGYVSIKLITSFKKVKSLTKDYRAVAFSLRQSDKLEVNEEGKKVRRKDPLPDHDETTPSRSIVAINLPVENPSIENVAELFSKCGEVALIRILRPGKPVPQDVKKHSAKHPEIGTSTCAVVEFENHDSAKMAVDTMSNSDDWRKGMRVVILAPSVKKKKDEETSKENDRKQSEEKKESAEGGDEKDHEKKKKRRGGRKNKNKSLSDLHNDDSSCYSSGSEFDQPTKSSSTSLSPNNMDRNRLSPTNSPRSSPRSSPMTSPRSQRRRLGPHGKSPLAEGSPGSSPRHSPRSSPEMGRKKYDYSSGGDSAPSSPWVQRRLKAAQEISKSPLANNSPVGSPKLGGRRNAEGVRRLLDMEGVMRQPKGPDGTTGFHMGRGKPRASTFS